MTNDVMVLNTDAGVVCIGQGTTQTIGPVEVTALKMDATVSDGNGH